MDENRTLHLLSSVMTPYHLLFLLILHTRVLIQYAVMLDRLLHHHSCSLTSLLPLVQVLEKDLHCHRLELQVNDLKQHIKQMVELTALQDQQNKRMQKYVDDTWNESPVN